LRQARPCKKATGPKASTLQILQLVRLVLPVIRIVGCVLHFCDDRPSLRKLRIQLKELFLSGWQITFIKDGVNRAFGFAQGAVDTFIRVDNQEIMVLQYTANRAAYECSS
jgi:hypothetical protein